MTNYADRGKWAEKEVAKVLAHYNSKYSKFAFDRLPDARAARGALKAQLCDFIAIHGGHPPMFYMVEVKEVKHDYRLPRDKVSQLPRMRAWSMAGGLGVILVFHSTIQKWRGIELGDLEGNPPSWDLSEHPTFDTALEAYQHVTVVPRS